MKKLKKENDNNNLLFSDKCLTCKLWDMVCIEYQWQEGERFINALRPY